MPTFLSESPFEGSLNLSAYLVLKPLDCEGSSLIKHVPALLKVCLHSNRQIRGAKRCRPLSSSEENQAHPCLCSVTYACALTAKP
jgi:hypothetical protein